MRVLNLMLLSSFSLLMISTNDYSGRKKIQDFIAFCHLGDIVKVIRAGGAACLFLVYPTTIK